MQVDFPQPPAAVFAYLGDPRRRPEWQSSLRRVEDVDGSGEAGTTWRDVTVLGARPRMRVTACRTGAHWAETGSWGGIDATLRLGFTPHGGGTRVHVAFDVHAARPSRRPVVAVLRLLAPRAVRADLRRAVGRVC